MKKLKITMVKKLFYLLFILFIITKSNGQIVDYDYTYGSSLVEESYDDFANGLVKVAELDILNSIRSFPDNPSNDKALLLRAKIDMASDNLNVAYGQLGKFIKSRSNSPFVPYAELLRGMIAYQLKKYVDAENNFESAAIYSESDIADRESKEYEFIAHQAYFWIGMSLSRQGKHLDAVSPFLTAAVKYPEYKFADDALYSIGRIYELNFRNDSAIYYFRLNSKTYQYSNTCLISLVREANNSLALRQPSSALIAVEKAETAVSHIISKDSVGMLYEDQYFFADILEKIYYLRGEAYNIGGNYNEAVKVFSYYLDTYSESEYLDLIRLGYGWALLNLNKNSEALVQYNIIIDKGEDVPARLRTNAQLYRVIALKRNGDLETAKKELGALSVLPTYPLLGIVLLELGQIYYEEGDYDSALKTLERSLLETQDGRIAVRINLLLGSVYMEKGLWERAVKEYKKAEYLADKANEIQMPRKNWYLSEARLKEGISLVKSYRGAEAISSIQTFIADNKGDARMDEALFWLAEAYYKTELLRNAIDTYEKIIKTYPASPRREESLYGIGWSFFRMKEFDKSAVVFDQMIKEFPKSKFAVEVLTRQADGFYLDKKFQKAADFYRRASKMAPGTEEGQYANYQLSHALYRMGSFEQAITSLLDFVRLYSKSKFAPNALYLVGWIRFQENKYKEAIDNFNFMITAYNQSTLVPRAYYAIGDCYFNMFDYDNAIKHYKIVIESYPGSELAPEAIKSIQYSLIALGREDEAIDIASKYVDTNPESPFAPVFQKKIGEMFYQGRKYKDAITEYEKFIDQHPQDESIPEVMYWMAKSYVSLNEVDKANEIFSKIQRFYPKNEYAPIAMLENGLLFVEQANISSADSVLKELQRIYPETNTAAQAGFERAVIKYKLADTASAMNIFLEVANKYPESDWADQSIYRIAMHYRNNGNFDSARYYFNIIAKIADNPKIASESQYRIGEMYSREQNYEAAIESYVIVKEKFEGYEDWYSLALLNLGEAYEKTGDNDSAKDIYTTLQSLRPEDDFGKTAKSRLKRIKKN